MGRLKLVDTERLETELTALGVNETETGDSIAGVDSKNPHYRPPRAIR